MLWKRLTVLIVTIGVIHIVSGIFVDRFQNKVDKRQRLEKDVAILNTYVTNEQVQNNAGKIFKRFPSTLNEAQQKQRLFQIADQTGLTLTAVQEGGSEPGGIPAFEPASSSNDDQTEKFGFQARTLSFSITAEGAFEQHIAFLQTLHEQPPFTRITNVSFDTPQRVGENVGLVSEFNMVLYYQK